jgi:anaerobic ribonucleoside-triphosphate reductase activating protein
MGKWEETGMARLKVAAIKPRVFTDGPGERVSVYLGGCSIGRSANPCPGCQSPHLWRADGWGEREDRELARELFGYGLPVTIIGGEPMDQPEGVAGLVFWLRRFRLDIDILLYSGYTWEELLARRGAEQRWTLLALGLVDTLVDGRYDPTQDDDFVQWRGSRNQRVIATGASLEGNTLVLRDWDSVITLTSTDAGVLAPIGVIRLMADTADATVRPHRKCGQVEREG